VKSNTIQDKQLNGLAADLAELHRNIQLFKAIEKNWVGINLLSDEDKKWVLFLKTTAFYQSVIFLCRLYESNPKKKKKWCILGFRNNSQAISKTRCIRTFLKEISVNNSNKPVYVEMLWGDFYARHYQVMQLIKMDSNEALEHFLDKALEYINLEYGENNKNTLLYKLKRIRNKRVAHNEDFIIQSKISIEDVELLAGLADSILEFTGRFLSLGQFSHYEKMDYVIHKQIDKIFKVSE
jgi:hypothetical protein